jgi:hypothetical protein
MTFWLDFMMSLGLFVPNCLLVAPISPWWTLLLRFVMRRLVLMMLAFCSLLLPWLLALRLVALHLLILLLMCYWPLLRLFFLLLMVRVLVFTVITMVEMNMWRHFATGRWKLRRLRLTILHRVLVVLVLEDLRGALLV